MNNIDALRISPNYTSNDWEALRLDRSTDWPKAAAIVRDRLEGRFLGFAAKCLKEKYSGFVVLSIDCLLAETIQQFREGITDGYGKSAKLFGRFLKGKHFQPDFDSLARQRFYIDIRCGLLHQAEAKSMWLIRRHQPSPLQTTSNGAGYIIDVARFHKAVTETLNDYLSEISTPEASALRLGLWDKMARISQVRNARGALYAAE